MTKQYAIDKAKILNRENNRSYFVILEPETDEYRIVEKKEKDEKQLNRYVIFSIEADE
ncbi:hypothetical protein [Cohnella nanjingensis]|uniref:Uncharacterized protein n=1 Tax=Cohnella nanjingensis TaxID=1387779 RepID=A0A7X0RT14_9BACL|nr:hypothetical protein [Cohnella nanjingensis]MBB6673167.1 hypothetical protein [Cohnella nanjingensis]